MLYNLYLEVEYVLAAFGMFQLSVVLVKCAYNCPHPKMSTRYRARALNIAVEIYTRIARRDRA